MDEIIDLTIRIVAEEGENSDDIPLLLEREAGRINEKGLKKSLENNQLWHLHETTGRLLPYRIPHRLRSLSRKDRQAVAEIVILDKGSTAQPIQESPGKPPAKERTMKAEPENSEDTLLTLSRIISERRRTMPEGSYTTHLFQSGPEKIRKKTGEEAIELLLASHDKDIVHEAADLIYHMMVLLESEGIAWEQVLAELKSRT